MEKLILENEGVKANFDTLMDAFGDGNIALVDCIDKRTNKHVPVICVVSHNPEIEGEAGIEMLPFAVMFMENPYDILIPPTDYANFNESDNVEVFELSDLTDDDLDL